MMLYPLLLRIAGGLALLGAIWLHGCSVGKSGEQRKAEAALVQQTADVLAKERAWAQAIKGSTDAKDTELRRVGTERDAAIASLRNRTRERLPAASRAACAGSTGAELSEPDAIDLVGLATRADQLRAALAECQGWIEAVKR